MNKTPDDVPAMETVEVKPGTYRLTPRAHRLIALAVNDARGQGRRTTKGEMVEQAIRATYGHLDSETASDTGRELAGKGHDD